jgi:hypothetical protein
MSPDHLARGRSARLRPRLSPIALGCALLLLIAGAAVSPEETTTGEGPLSSDTLVPVNSGAVELLAVGDLARLRALEGGADTELAWGQAFEAWHEALSVTELGEGVPAGPTTETRRTEGIEYAVERRLGELEVAFRRGWTDRFSALADGALARVSPHLEDRELELRRLEHLHPATPGAARAALELFGITFEEGRRATAEIWLDRAARHATLGGWNGVEEAIERRSAALRASSRLVKQEDASPWEEAAEFETRYSPHPLLMPGWSKPLATARYEGPPGIAFLDDRRIAVQTTRSVWILSPKEGDREFVPWRVAKELGQPIPRTVEHTGRDWPFLPESDGKALYLVSGRADGVVSNFVQKIAPPRELEVPEPIWSLGGDGLHDAAGNHTPLEAILDPGLWEFQPGPELAGDLLLVHARHWSQSRQGEVDQVNTPGEARAWLLALDAASGRPRWKRLLCRGTDIVADFGARFASRPLVRTPGQPPVVVAGRIFVGTNLGAGFLLDLADGRLVWSYLNRRRDPKTPGWEWGGPSPVCPDPDGGPATILWAPSDSDFLYPLVCELDFDTEASLLAYPPLPIGESEILIGGEANLALVLGRAGARRTLSAHELHSGRRYDSVFLGREEGYLAGPLIGEKRILFAGERGLYRLDRERELYLELFVPMDLRSEYESGGVWIRGEEMYLLAKGELLFLEVGGDR